MNPFDSSSSIYCQKVEFSNGEDSGAGSEEGLDMTDEPIKTNPHRSGSKRSMAAEVHNMFEKRRRSGINEKMKALQNLIPNSNKAFAEWVLFTSSGISSGLYHACDVGTWCVLSFRVLQFMDFWLSFMAVISTFIYMATISETSKRAIHTVVAIITALLAVTGATRSANIVLVVVIGTLGLFVGWLLEFLTSYHFTFHTVDWNFYATDSWRNIKRWFRNLINTLNKRFHWPLVVLGFAALAFAGTCWKLENHQSYWVWHSLWHISIYSSSFLFLWSTSANNNSEVQPAVYELTRQDSLSRT